MLLREVALTSITFFLRDVFFLFTLLAFAHARVPAFDMFYKIVTYIVQKIATQNRRSNSFSFVCLYVLLLVVETCYFPDGGPSSKLYIYIYIYRPGTRTIVPRLPVSPV